MDVKSSGSHANSCRCPRKGIKKTWRVSGKDWDCNTSSNASWNSKNHTKGCGNEGHITLGPQVVGSNLLLVLFQFILTVYVEK